MRPYMKGTNLAISGDVFGPGREPAKIRGWLELRDGKYAGLNVEQGVTHFLCSESHYKKNIKAVRDAERLDIPVVTWDWLEDSMLKEKKVHAKGKYLCRQACRMSAAEKTNRAKREREAMRKDSTLPSRDPDSALSMAAGFFDQHLANLEDGASKRTKPDVEEYTLYNKILKTQDICTSGGNDEDDDGGSEKQFESGESSCSDHTVQAEDVTVSDQAEHSLAPPTSSMISATPSSEQRASSTRPRHDSPSSKTSGPRTEYAVAEPPSQKPILTTNEQLERTSPAPTPSSSSSPSGLESSNALPQPNSAKTTSRTMQSEEPAPPPYPPTHPTIRPRLQPINTDPIPDLENHHLYRDVTNFAYDIKLFRIQLTQNTNERYILRFYESHSTPHNYAVHLRYFSSSKKNKTATPYVRSVGLASAEGTTVVPVGSTFTEAFRVFRETFKELSGVVWEERLDVEKAGKMRPGDGGGMEERFFKYWGPKDGEPKGVFRSGIRASGCQDEGAFLKA